MTRVFPFIAFILIAFNLYLASGYVRQGDLLFTADISRDFHLIKEIDEKKLILIGERASGELYHGIIWLYLNYPAYILGHGNPLIIAWWWIALSAFFITTCYFIAAKLFNSTLGWLYALITSLYVTFHAFGLFHPHAAMFTLPIYFYFFIRYWQTGKVKYLIFHLITTGALVHFELAVGTPLTALSVLAITTKIFYTKRFSHFVTFLIIPLMLSNFIIFDLRHDHILLNKLTNYVTPQTGNQTFNYLSLISNRLQFAFSGIEFVRPDPGYRNLTLTVIFFLMIIFQIKNSKYKLIYQSFLYFYFGFFILSFINKGPILSFHFFPFFPLVFLILISFTTIRYQKIFLILFALLYLFNLNTSLTDQKRAVQSFIGKDPYSWKFLSTIARQVYASPDSEIGYFVYSPDVLAYEAKYAFWYESTQTNKSINYFIKKSITYLIIAPPPKDNPYMKDAWWRQNQLNIDSDPAEVINFSNGYKIEKYFLDESAQKIPFDPAIDPGIHFR